MVELFDNICAKIWQSELNEKTIKLLKLLTKNEKEDGEYFQIVQ